MDNKQEPAFAKAIARRSKILYVITQAEMGGAQRYLYDLATSFEAQNYDISVAIGQSQDKSLIYLLRSKNLPVYELKRLVRAISPINDFWAIFELRKLYQKIKPDIIHLNSTKAGIIGSLANHTITKISYKVIYTAHGWVFNEPMSKIKKWLYWGLEKITSRPKDKIICVSAFDYQTAIKYKIAGTKKLITIHNGIDISNMNFLSKEKALDKLIKNYELTDYSPTPTHPPSGSGRKIIIGTIANFYKTKGLEYLIGATKILISNSQYPIFLIIIGDGELRPQLEELIKKYDLENNIILAGRQENASQYLKAFDIYVSSSVKEGLPYSILEAMAAELPIITTAVGGLPEMIKDNDNGLLIEPKNYKILAEKIKYLIENKPLAQRLGQQARQDVKENFSKEKMIRETFKQYQ